MLEVTLDSCVLVSAFVEGDKFRPQAREIIGKVFSGEYRVVTSAVVPVEVCGVIVRRASQDKGELVRSQIDRWEEVGFFTFKDLTSARRRGATNLAIKFGLRGVDAIVVQVAKERGSSLITFDTELAEKASKVVRVLTHRDFKR